MATTVINKRYAYKFPGVDNVVYIGRPSEWGNPFVIGVDGNRKTVIGKYRRYIMTRLSNEPKLFNRMKKELKDKTLVCWCKPLPCHGDVLMELLDA
jgi:hypothetical protein